MLTRVNHNLRKHLSTPALGPVKPQLEGLANKTKDVAETCQKFFANQGSALVASGDGLERDWQISEKYDTKGLQKSIKNVKGGLQEVHSDVTRLRGEAHTLIEATRGRSQQLRTDATTLQQNLDAKQKEQSDLKSAIDNLEREISNKESEARNLESQANDSTVGGGVATGTGTAATVLGILAAPFTFGTSLIATGVGITGIVLGAQELEKAAGLRSSAESQRRSVRDMRSRVSSYEDDISRLKKDRENKKQELEKIEDFQRTVQSVLNDLNAFESQLNSGIKNVLDFEVAVTNLSKTAGSLGILQKVANFNKRNGSSRPAAQATYDSCVSQWREIRGFLNQLKSIE